MATNLDTDVHGQTFKNFQLTADTASKRTDDYGKVVARHIVTSSLGPDGYIGTRNARFALNRAIASGSIDIEANFRSQLGFEDGRNYLALQFRALKMVNTIIGRMVGRWNVRNEKIYVTATDTLSITQKIEQYESIEFELQHRKAIAELEQATGVPLVPKDQFRPDDQEELELWRQELQRLPEEILYQTNINDSLDANGWFDVLKEMILHDSAECGLVGTYTCMDEQGVIRVEHIPSEDILSSYSRFNDFRDTAWRGRALSMKIIDIRRRYGKEFGGKLDEKQIFDIAQRSKEYQSTDKLSWLDQWETNINRPYDDFNVDVIEFEVKTVDTEGYVIHKTKSDRTYIRPNRSGENLKENQQYVEDKYYMIYRGVYVREADMMLEWGPKKNMIRPQDPKESGNCEFSYSFYMYQNKGMRNVAIPEKIEAPYYECILILLKLQQLIVALAPENEAINISALEEVFLGLGDKDEATSPAELLRIKQQTGRILYRGIGADGKPIPVPIQQLGDNGFLSRFQALQQAFAFQQALIKDEIGEDPNLAAQAITPRVSQGNIQTAQQVGEFSTDYIYSAYTRVMGETAKKMACLMATSVKYGAKAYRGIMDINTVKDRVFGTKIRLLPTAADLQRLESFLNQAIASTPDLVMYLDAFKVMRIAQEDIKLGELYYRQAMKKMLQSKAEQASKNMQENTQMAIETEKAKNEGAQKLKDYEAQTKIQVAEANGKSTMKTAMVTGLMKMFELAQTNGTPLPPEMRAIAPAILENIALPAMIENDQTRQAVAAQMQQALLQQQMQEDEENSVAGQQEPELPQPQMQSQQPEMVA